MLGGVTITVVNEDKEDGTGANIHDVKSHGGAEGGRPRNQTLINNAIVEPPIKDTDRALVLPEMLIGRLDEKV